MKKILEEFDLFCFDFDGLLVNSEPLHQAAYNKALSRFDLSNEVDFFTYCAFAHHKDGSRLKKLYQSLFDTLDDRLWKQILKNKQRFYTEIITSEPLALMPGAEELLVKLLEHDKTLCVVTNSSKHHTQPFREALPLLNEIPLWITKEDVARTKPHPDGYIKALVHYAEIPERRALGLDDALKGITAIQNAGISPLLVCNKKHPQLKHITEELSYAESLTSLL